MASSNKTDKLQLPQWQLSDKPEMEDFNDAFEKVEDFKDEFDSHLAESAKKHIHDSDEGSSYIQFDDGTMLCWYKNGSVVTDTDLTWNYPKPFINYPTVIGSAARSG